MRFRLLGPLRVWDGTDWSAIRAPQQRVVLSLLLIEAGRPVSTDRLVDELWGDDPPRSAAAVLRGYVMRLRRALGGGTGGPLVTGDGGYRLDVEGDDDLDGWRFDRLVAAGRRALAEGEPRAAADRLAEALALWRGAPLADVPPTPTVAAQVTRLEQARLAATEEYLGARLESGHHLDVVDELRRLVEEHPLRERFWAQLMLALDRCGRRDESLAAYQRASEVLSAELGVEPGPTLRDLRQMIIADGDRPAAEPGGGDRLTPNCLPADHPAFAGRDGPLAHLASLLGPAAVATPLVLVTGAAGMGKTTLATHWAHRVADHFPDGQLFVNLRGFGPTGTAMSPDEVVRALLGGLGLPAARIPANLDAQISHYRSLLAGRRMLIVLDNARDPEQVRPLVPASPGCLVLVTSRNQLTGLVAADGAYPVRLDALPTDEARRLLAHRIGAQRLAAEPAATDEIIDRCAGLPLALTIVAARAAIHPHFPLRALARELGAGLDGFAGGDDTTDVRAALSWSVQALRPEVARLFRLLALHPGPDVSAPAAASLAGLPGREAGPMLAELARAHLVDEPAPGRYALHDLLRAYALELTEAIDDAADRHAALRRTLDHYLHTGYAAARLLEPDRDPIDLPAALTGVEPEHLADHRQAIAWFTAERPALLTAAVRAAAAGLDRHAWQLPWTLASFLDSVGHWHEQVAVQRIAGDAGARLGEPHPQIRALNSLARAYVRLGRADDADRHFRRATALSDGLGADDPVRAHTRINVGSFLATRGRHAEALTAYQEARELYQAMGHRGGQARTLGSIGWCHAMRGDHHRALDYCRQALELAREVGDRGRQGEVWDTMGVAYHGLGDHARAADCYERALALHRETGHRYLEATTLVRLGDSRRAGGPVEAARPAWRQALAILRQLGHPDADGVDRRLRADGAVSIGATSATPG